MVLRERARGGTPPLSPLPNRRAVMPHTRYCICVKPTGAFRLTKLREAKVVTATPRPTEEEVRSWLDVLSNWGRWGSDDDMGTLNYIGAEERSAAVRLAVDGSTVSCALPIVFEKHGSTTANATSVGPDRDWSRPERYVIQDASEATRAEMRFPTYDAFLIAPHGPVVTHLDAPRHTVLGGHSYNDLAARATGSRGTIESVSSGILGRGVLLDVARSQGRAWLDDGAAIYPADLELCEAETGVRVGRGDLLFVRTGYRRRVPGRPPARHAPRPGLHAACLPWLHERQVAVLGADTAVDVIPHDYEALGLPIHTVGMWAMGLWLLDNCGLERLSEVAAETGRSTFLALLAPLNLTGASASPVNPIAVF